MADSEIRPTPEKRPTLAAIARLMQRADEFARKPFGYENPPVAMASDFLSIPPLYRTIENYAYGSPLASGTSSVSRYLPKLTEDTKGAIEGAINVAPMAGPVVRGTRAVAGAAAPYAARQAVGLAEKYGVAPTMSVIKPEGGNWVQGAAQKYIEPMRRKTHGSDPATVLKELNEKYGDEGVQELMAAGTYPNLQEYAAINRFVDKKLARYIQNEMGTPSDSLRLQADAWADTQQKLMADKQKQIDKVRADIAKAQRERNVDPEVLTRSQARLRELQKEQDLIKNRKGIHSVPQSSPVLGAQARREAGMPEENMGVAPNARRWENLTDRTIQQASYEDLIPTLDMPSSVVEMYKAAPAEEKANVLANWKKEQLERLGGQYAVDNPEALAYGMNAGVPARELGFDHMVDELQNSLFEGGVPEYLRLTPKTLDKMSVAQAAEHVDKINAWRASQKAEVDKARAANAATVVHKEYPEQGLKWVELKVPEMLEDFKAPERYEIRKPTPSSETFAIWDKEKQGYITTGLGTEEAALKHLHQTLNQNALQDALKYEGEILQHCVGGYCPDVMEGKSRIFSLRDADGRPHATIEVQPVGYKDVYRNLPLEQKNEINAILDKWASNIDYMPNSEELIAKSEQVMAQLGYKPKEQIFQIKGAQNRKPEAEFIPYVQDFVKSGDWSDVGDIKNTDLYRVTPGQKLPGFSKEIDPGYYTLEDFQKMAAENEMPQEILDSWMGKLQGMYRYGYAEGGKKKPSPFDELEPTFGDRMGAAAADKLTEAGLWLYDKLANREGISSAHRIYLDTFLDDKRDPITAKDFSQRDLDELQNLILQKEKLTGNKGTGYIKYEDYGNLPGGDRRGNRYGSTFSGVMSPRPSLSNSLGQFNYEYDPKTKQYRIIDEYDFNPQKVTHMGEKYDVPPEFYGDYIPADLSLWKLARLYGGRKMPPGKGRKVELSVPGKAEGGLFKYDPDEIAQLAASVSEGLAPYGVRHSGEGVKGKGYFGALPNKAGGVSTEISAEDESGEYPLMVPTLSAEELDSLLADQEPTEEMRSKARSWADTRRARGQSPFAEPNELRMPRPGYAEGGLAMQAGGIASLMKLITKLGSEVKKAEKAGDTKEALNKREQLNEAIRSAVNDPDMPRAQPLSQAEIRAYAERMAPQVAGEMTRKPKSSQTIAGKSQKQFKREKTLPVRREVMPGAVDPMEPLPIMTLEEQKDSVLLGLPGDPSLARMNLYGIGDVEFARPVGLHGGPRFGDDEKLWASNLGAATGLLNTADRASRQYGNAPIIASYMKMPSGLPFAQHYFESLLQYQRPDELSKAAKSALTKDIRAGYVDGEGNRITFPDFPGFDDLDKVAEMAQADSGLRKHIAGRLEKSDKYGLRSAADVQFAVSHPELTNLETGASGFTLGELIPAPLTESAHPTYSHDIAGRVLGQMRYSTPYDLLYRDQLELIRRNPKSPEFNTLKLMGARQKIDEQLINEINEYQERMRQLIGKYKGGIIKKAQGGLVDYDPTEIDEIVSQLKEELHG